MSRRVLPALLLITFCAAAVQSGSGDEPESGPSERAAVIAGLAEFNSLVGEWRGIGMTKRYSRQGAWQETAEWVWKLDSDSAALLCTVTGGKLLDSARLTYEPKQKLYRLETAHGDAPATVYRGTISADRLVLDSAADAEGFLHRITLRRLNEDRATMLFEKRPEKQSFYGRVAEVAWQRAGTKLAASDASGPECIVTGGKGTIVVEHAGRTYYVCCSGCRDAFLDDPEGILAEAKSRAPKTRP